jgi:hypothetical protein
MATFEERGRLMATGKYLSLEEARKKKQLERFAREHPTKGDEKKFDALLDRMAKNSAANEKT